MTAMTDGNHPQGRLYRASKLVSSDDEQEIGSLAHLLRISSHQFLLFYMMLPNNPTSDSIGLRPIRINAEDLVANISRKILYLFKRKIEKLVGPRF